MTESKNSFGSIIMYLLILFTVVIGLGIGEWIVDFIVYFLPKTENARREGIRENWMTFWKIAICLGFTFGLANYFGKIRGKYINKIKG